MTWRRPISKEAFIQAYVIERQTLEQISVDTHVPRTTLSRWQREWGVPTVKRIPDKVGLRFGKLVVQQETRTGGRGVRTNCICLCDCGREVTVGWGNLNQGFTKSCGCSKEVENIIGRKFNRLTVLERLDRVSKLGHSIICYRCACDCGKETVLVRSALLKGGTKSCGCVRSPTIPKGTRFERLVVLQKVKESPGHFAYECQCDCGKRTTVNGTILKRGMTKSCGCLAIDKARLPDGVASMNSVIHSYKKNARNHNREYALTDLEMSNLLQQPCFYCGQLPKVARVCSKHGGFICNGIDRKDNARGYTIDNAVPCCWDCNRGKGRKTIEEFWKWVNRIHAPSWEYPALSHPPISVEGCLFRSHAYQAPHRHLVFDLTETEATQIFRSPCAYCGEPHSNLWNKKYPYTGIDRVDNTLGYLRENCLPSCKWCNRAKREVSLPEFLEWAKRVQAYRATSTR